jgi:hypothetical protein
MADTKAKAKPKRKAAAKKPPSKNHFTPGGGTEPSLVCIGTLKGVSAGTDIDTVREEPESVRFVGDVFTAEPYTGHGPTRKKITEKGDALRVFVGKKGVVFTPECGENGIAITHETLEAVTEAVKASQA